MLCVCVSVVAYTTYVLSVPGLPCLLPVSFSVSFAAENYIKFSFSFRFRATKKLLLSVFGAGFVLGFGRSPNT